MSNAFAFLNYISLECIFLVHFALNHITLSHAYSKDRFCPHAPLKITEKSTGRLKQKFATIFDNSISKQKLIPHKIHTKTKHCNMPAIITKIHRLLFQTLQYKITKLTPKYFLSLN